jgi:quaternary ammonium compound-resistance protein SugE
MHFVSLLRLVACSLTTQSHAVVGQTGIFGLADVPEAKETLMDWVLLIIAGVFEIVWATGLKYTDGFTRLWPSAGTLAAMAVSMVLLAQALRTIPVGTGYAIWTGIGAAGTAVMGIVLFGESRQALRLLCIALIVAGIVGLKFSSEP